LRDETRIFYLQIIFELTEIPIVVDGNQNPRSLDEYMFFMRNVNKPRVEGLMPKLCITMFMMCVGG